MNEPSGVAKRVELPVLGRREAGDGLEAELRAAVGGEVRFGRHDRMLYATDASLYQVEPLGVVIPRTVEDAARAVEVCVRRGVAVLPRGGGTSLAGQCTNRAVVVDTSRWCVGVRSVDTEAGRCVVDPGVTIDDLNTQLAPTGWFFAPDPATSRHACIGGCIGNNAAGARSIRYGRTSENVSAVEVVLASGERLWLRGGGPIEPESGGRDSDAQGRTFQPTPGPATGGRAFQPAFPMHPREPRLASAVSDIVLRHERLIRERFPRTLRRNAGYGLDTILAQLDAGVAPERVNLTPLLCGSEGTLAFTLGAELKLARIPAGRGLAVLSFAGVDEAIALVPAILETVPSAVELLDDLVIGLARANREYRRDVDLLPDLPGGPVRAVLYVEYFADRDPTELPGRFEALRRLVPGAGVATHTDPGAMARAWALRKAGEPLLHGIPGDRKPVTFVEDNAVPVERLGEFVRRFREIVTRHGTQAAFYAHASVGVLHVRPLVDPHDPADRRVMHAIATEVADLARELGGVMSGEHGDGKLRSPLLERFYGPELIGAMREVKTLFDPRGLMNPGNIVEPLGAPGSPRRIESITERMRLNPEGPERRVPPLWTHFRFADQHGFPGAVEMCNGAGVCRKRSGGTMCPSYQATLDERHSTRGRGNALRLAVTGQFAGPGGAASSPAWNDAETLETLDLCLSCKACKAECPSNVDVARLKAEYLAQSYAAHGGAPLAARLMGDVRTLNRVGSRMPALANFVARSALGKALARRVLGIDPRRSLPPLRRALGRRLGADVARRPADLPQGRPALVLFGDCFTMFNEPGVGLAGVRLAQSFGYAVGLADAGCCARPRISLGLLREAARTVAMTASRLAPWARDERVRAIVVMEPSCRSAMADDWLDLRSPAPVADLSLIASKVTSLETFLGEGWGDHPRTPARREGDGAGPVLYHGHCHAKALWGDRADTAVVERLAGERLRVLDSGCCGMAGSFGYAERRFDLSMRVGELSLLPSVRQAGPGAEVLSAGTSCRHQIADGAGVRALHPVEWLAERLA